MGDDARPPRCRWLLWGAVPLALLALVLWAESGPPKEIPARAPGRPSRMGAGLTALDVTSTHVGLGMADGRVVVTSRDGRHVYDEVAHDGPVRALHLRPEADHLGLESAGADGTLRRTELAACSAAAQLCPRGSARRLRFAGARLSDAIPLASGDWLAAGEGGDVVRLGPSGAGWRAEGVHGAGALAVALSPDGASLASGGAHAEIVVRGADDGVERVRFRGHRGWVAALLWTAEGLYSGGTDHAVVLFDPAGRMLRQWEAHQGPVTALDVDDRWLLTGAEDGTARIYNRADGALVTTLTVDAPARAVRLFDALAWVASADGHLRVFQVPDGKELPEWPTWPR